MITKAKCKKCRRFGQKLFLRGDRCFGQKCAMIRRAYPPGVHGKKFRPRLSEYGQQLAEKQRIRISYGISEEQFKKYYKEVVKRKGDKEILFIQKLETRLDNVVFRLGFVSSRRLARQVVSHGHVLVNGRRVDIPSFAVKKGDKIVLREKSAKSVLFQNLKAVLKKHQAPDWLFLNIEKSEGEVKALPQLKTIGDIGNISRVVEYYSR